MTPTEKFFYMYRGRGEKKAVADQLGIRNTAISQWKYRCIPARYAKRIEEITGGKIKASEIIEEALEKCSI